MSCSFMRMKAVSCMVLLLVLTGIYTVWAFKERESKNALEEKEFQIEALYISSQQIPLAELINQLAKRDAWFSFLREHENAYVYFDPRSGKPVSLMYPHPFIPGSGEGNTLTMQDISNMLGYHIEQITPDVVKALALHHLTQHAELLGIDPAEIGQVRAVHTADYLWHISIDRLVNGIPVRDAYIAMTVNHGNLVLWGLEKWGDLSPSLVYAGSEKGNYNSVSLTPAVSKEAALQIGFQHIGGQLAQDAFIARPHLEIIPVSPEWNGMVGQGYDYILAWVFTFRREGFHNTWEMIVDAHQGQLVSFMDTNQYVTKKVIGAVYPVSDDECCPDGCSVANIPFPYVDVSGHGYTNYGGLYDYSSGTVCTTLTGKHIRVYDGCGPINVCSDNGDINLGGGWGQHDCTIPPPPPIPSTGNTFPSRTSFVEITHLNRMVRSWSNIAWLDSYITCNVNINSTCNAYFSGNTINFYRGGGGCRNTGELAGVFDHEWTHAVDTHDAQPSISQPGEAIADVLTAYRLHYSCIGRGFFWTLDRGCGQWNNCPTDPGTSYGYNCSGYNSSECCLNCTGIRQIDYGQHADPDADTPANFACTICGSGSGTPCGKETHCEGIPPAEAGWDLADRDLQAPPFNFERQTAFEFATKIAIQGHNNVTSWYSCTCPSTSSGCGATNAYPNWIAAEDDDGNVNNGTPHMTAIYNAFDRHGIACPTPTPQNSGCTGGPSTAPILAATPGNNSVALSWTAVTGAANYYVLRTEGVYGCDFGKTKIATVATTTYTDNEALNGRTYYYTIWPVGSNTNCLGLLSNCVSATPSPCVSCASYQVNSATVTIITGGDSDLYMDNCESATIQVTIDNMGSGTALNTQVNITVTEPFLDITTPMPINVGDIPFGGSVNTTFGIDIGHSTNKASCLQTGTFNISVQSTGQDPAADTTFDFSFEGDWTIGSINWPFETGLDGWTVEDGTWTLNSTRVNPGGSTQSLRSSQMNQNCDIMISPEFEATSTTTFHAPNWYDIEPFASGYWYDRANIWVVQGATETLINPAGGKLYVTGTFYDWTEYCDQGPDKPGWSGAGTTWGDSVFDLGSYNGQKIRLRLKYMTDDLSYGEGYYIDDAYLTNVKSQGCDAFPDDCAGGEPPGGIQNTSTLSKVGSDLVITWEPPGGACAATCNNIYIGFLPWTGYDYMLLECCISESTYSLPQIPGSYYFVVVPANELYEGSYGKDSNSIERPQSPSTCRAQDTTPCN